LKKVILNSLKIVLPLGLGLFLVGYYFNSLNDQDLQEIKLAFSKANYSWIYLSFIFAILSHLSRAYRWKFTLEPLNYHPKFLNSFFSVMIAYLVNLAVPRLGELTRCGVMARYEDMSFQKLLGTVIAERIADLIILIIVTSVVVVIQYDVIQETLNEVLQTMGAKIPSGIVLLILAALGIFGLFVLIRLLNSSSTNPMLIKIRGFLRGLSEGIRAIYTMKKKWAFIFHTVFIWVMYLAMYYICFFSLPETSEVPWGGVLTSFVLGGITIVLTNGGIGAYPLAIMGVLLLYGVDKNIGGAFGWIVWTAQTALLIVFGALSFALMPLYNSILKKSNNE